MELGNPCVKVSVDAESDGRLTAREFYYRKKLFEKLNIIEEEVKGKNFVELYSILRKKSSSLEEDLKHKNKLIDDINSWARCGSLCGDQVKKLRNELDKHLLNPDMQLFSYIFPLEKCRSLIRKDKQVLTQKFIKRRDDLLSSIFKAELYTLPPLALAEASYCCYFLPTWLIASNTLMCLYLLLVALSFVMVPLASLTEHYEKKYKNSEISTDQYVNRKNCIYLCYKLFVFYPLPVFFTSLMIEGFISNSLYVDVTIFGTLSLLALLATEVFSSAFSKGCEIYAEKHAKDLLEEDPRDRVQKETDLLGRYDPRRILMPIIMPLVRKCFAEVASEFAERNFDEVKTDMSYVNAEGLSKPKEIEFAQQPV
ncbi:molecular chaperone DnaJ [Wolbachia endosymbiont of Cylisticus convexus]|uniref:molecular chaperone DnaJ n=1 Tax=Wolbachia endosymbiont of Cylisticus convexus TaxID=118728 RepID=UPI001F1AFE90|nr:molecular chaperone DnaJ [Wolbachia endosymbiont of Cylisticus convexus]